MRRVALLWMLMLSSVALAAPTPVGLQAAWAQWQFSAPVIVGNARSELVAVTVPLDITARAAPEWADLRVIDANGREIPYVLHARHGASTADWRSAAILEPSFTVGQFTQVVADGGRESRVHNAARLRIGGAADFVTWVEIAASDDGRRWRVVRERAPIYRLMTAGIGENLTVGYPDSVSRYQRFRLLDGSQRYAIDAVDLAAVRTSGTELAPADFTFEHREEPGRSVWTSTGAVSTLPIAAVRFDTVQPEFLRLVVVESSGDAAIDWRRQSSGEIYRMTERGQPRTSLSVRISERSAARWRITVYNRNDSPLPDLRPVLQTVPRRVVFRVDSSKPYRLAFGNPRASRPEYEMSRLVERDALDTATPATLGEVQPNASYQDARPWTERHSAALWTALGIALLAVGVLAIRTLQAG